MELNQAIIAEVKMEAANTRKMLQNVPLDKGDFKPHEKSMTLARLASHVAELPAWIESTMAHDELDFSKMEYKPVIPTTTEELLALHDKSVNQAIAARESAKNEDFGKMWTLRNGETVYFTMPKMAVLRGFALSHLYHHRGQLSVYLRLTGAMVPGMYGPSKDETEMMGQPA